MRKTAVVMFRVVICDISLRGGSGTENARPLSMIRLTRRAMRWDADKNTLVLIAEKSSQVMCETPIGSIASKFLVQCEPFSAMLVLTYGSKNRFAD